MQYAIRSWLCTILVVLISTILHTQVGAATKEANLSYEVKILSDENASDKTQDYFYFQVKPSTTKQFSFEIINNSDIKKKYNVDINRAVTNVNGYIDYSLGNKSSSESMEVDFNKIVSFRAKEVEVPANDKKKVTVELNIPSTKFKGIVLGGIYVTEVKGKSSMGSQKETSGLEFEQELAYAVAVMLQEETPYKEGNELALENIELKVHDGQSYLQLTTENIKPNVLNDISLKVDMYKNDEEKIYKTLKKDNMTFAPNSRFNLEVPWTSEKLSKGDYKTVTTFRAGKEKWQFENVFSISQKAVDEVTKDNPMIEKPNNVLRNILIGICAVLVITLILVLLVKRKKSSN